MNMLFADMLKKLRRDKGLSQQALAEKMFVTRSAVTRWENGSRLPDAAMISRLADVLSVNANVLLSAAAESDKRPVVIMVDDNRVILDGSLPILEEIMPNAAVTGFTKPSEAIEYAKANRVALALLDIEMGTTSGLDVCRELLEVNPRTNVVYLTAYSDYALDAWSTGASGFMLKPITTEGVTAQLEKLRYPFFIGGEDE
ncbi:MAG: response regulator [Clostridia bacterium]|nr:response regulator [Clostridia bacterium]